MSDFPLTRILSFIQQVAPFDVLDAETVSALIGRMEVAYHPRGTVIAEAGCDPPGHLYIIQSGSVEIALPSGQEEDLLVDVRGEGDVFGAVSLLSGRKALFSIRTREDLLAFLLPADDFRSLVDRNPAFQAHFRFALARDLESAAGSSWVGSAGSPAAGFDEMPRQMRRRVSELMTPMVVSCAPDTSASEAARIMSASGVGSVVVAQDLSRPLGILTDTDLRNRVLAAGAPTDTPVDRIMSRPPLSISHQAFGFEAMLDMTRHGVHHLVVTEGERMVGLVSDHDLKVVTGSSPVGLVREIDKAGCWNELDRLPAVATHLLDTLMYWRGSAEYLMDLFSEITDRMTIKLFGVVEGDMAADGLGAPPADYCWLSLAEAGRREQVPPLYQNHALIYSQAGSEPDDRFQNWFLEFARRVTAGLARWGRQPSPSGLLASDPRWLRSTLTWRRLALEWAADADPNHPPAGWFDFRPVTGEPGYIHHLKRDMLEAAAASDRPTALFRAGWSKPPPIGFLRQAVVENDGTYAPTLGLSRPLELIVSGVRALAWRHRIEETNTLARLSRLAAEGLVPGNLAADLRESFSFITLFRIERFIEAQKNNQPYQDQTAPSELSGTKRRRFKDCFAVLADFGRRLETWLKAGPSAHTG